MTNEEFTAYLNKLPPELRDQLLERVKQAADYVSRATHVRRKIHEQFPALNPRLAAAASLVIARFT
jgi:hypothetical protein